MFVCRWRKASRLALALSALVVFILVPGAGRAQSNPPAWSSSAVYAVGDQVQTGGNVYRAITKISSPSGTSPAVDYTHWQLSQVLSNTTLLIGGGQTFPNLVTAWTYALYARVADGVYLHFYISTARGDFQEDFGGPFLLDHGSGARIAILGDNLNNVYFTFFGTNAFIIDTGHSLNTLSGFSVTNQSSGNTALKADGNATISAVSAVIFNNFLIDLQSTQNSTMTVESNCIFEQVGSEVADVESNGSLYCPGGLTATGPGTNTLAQGFYAASGGVIIAPSSSLTAFGTGVQATSGAKILIDTATLSQCSAGIVSFYEGYVQCERGNIGGGSVGCDATERGVIDVTSATVTGDSSEDLQASDGGFIDGTLCFYGSLSVGSNDDSYIQP